MIDTVISHYRIICKAEDLELVLRSRLFFANAITAGISTVAHVLTRPLRSPLLGVLFIGIGSASHHFTG